MTDLKGVGHLEQVSLEFAVAEGNNQDCGGQKVERSSSKLWQVYGGGGGGGRAGDLEEVRQI